MTGWIATWIATVSGGRPARRLAAPLAAVLLLAGPAPASELGDVLRQAFETSAAIRAAEFDLAAEHQRRYQAEAGTSHTITLNSRALGTHIRDQGIGSTDKVSGSVFFEVSRTMFDAGRVAASLSEADARIVVAASRLRQVEQDVLRGAVDAYIAILEGQRLLALARANRLTLASEADAARNRFDLGSGTRTEVALADARLAESDTALSRRVGELEIARSRYETAIGTPPPMVLPELLDLPELPASLPEALEMAARDHPELHVRRATVVVAEQARQRLSALDPGEGLRIFGSVGATHDSLRQRRQGMRRTRPEISAGLGYTVSLYDGGGKAARVEEADRRVDIRNAELRTAEARLRDTVVAAWETLQIAESTIKSGHTRIMATGIALEGTRRAAQGGQASTLDVLDGERELLDAETAVVRAEYSRLAAAFSLRAAIGSLNLGAFDS